MHLVPLLGNDHIYSLIQSIYNDIRMHIFRETYNAFLKALVTIIYTISIHSTQLSFCISAKLLHLDANT